MSNPDKDYVGQDKVNERLGTNVFNGTLGVPAYDADNYQFEKLIGKRTKTGVIKLKRLKASHKNVLAMHLRCLSNRDIALITGLHEARVGGIIRDPLAQEYIQEHLSGMDSELASLAPLAVDAVRTGLNSADEKVKLVAADKFFKATGKYDSQISAKETAEDVLARALARVALEAPTTLRQVVRPPALRVIEGSAVALPAPSKGEE